MQVNLHTDHHLDNHEAIALHLDNVVTDALARFTDQVSRVEAHIGDREGHAKSSPDGVRCMLEARLNGLPPVSVTEHAPTVHQAIGGASGKLARAVDSALGRHAAKRTHGAAIDAIAEPPREAQPAPAPGTGG